MKLSTKGRYGTRVLVNLALRGEKQRAPLKDIARIEQISLPYLERLISPLIASGMIRSARGAKGGVWLAKSPSEIKLSEVVQLLEGSIALVECIDDPKACPRSDFCATRDTWGELKKVMDGVLESTTLQDLAERQKMKGRVGETMYYI